MKKLLIVASAISLGFVACQKEQVAQNEGKGNTNLIPMSGPDVNDYPINTTVQPGGFCDVPASNCRSMPEVVITPSQNEIFSNQSSFSKTYVGSLVADSENANLFGGLPADLKAELLNAQYGMTVLHNTAEGIVLIFGESDDVSYDDLVFGMQFGK